MTLSKFKYFLTVQLNVQKFKNDITSQPCILKWMCARLTKNCCTSRRRWLFIYKTDGAAKPVIMPTWHDGPKVGDHDSVFFFYKKTTLRCSRQWSSVRALMNRGEFFFPHENLFASAPGQVRWTLWIFSTGKQPLKENWRCVRFVICGFLFWFSRIFLKNKKFH